MLFRSLEADKDNAPPRLLWTGTIDGKPARLTAEPGASAWHHIKLMFYSILPGMEELL